VHRRFSVLDKGSWPVAGEGDLDSAMLRVASPAERKERLSLAGDLEAAM
jgi:hypothetical protein